MPGNVQRFTNWYTIDTIVHRHQYISSMLIILFIAYLQLNTVNGQQKGDEVCETLPSEIHLIKGIKFVIN